MIKTKKTKSKPKTKAKAKTKAKVKVRTKTAKIKKKETGKEKIEKTIEKTKEAILSSQADRYYESQGRRKTAIARVRVWTKGGKEFLINQKPIEKYFQVPEVQKIPMAPLEKMKCIDKFRISVIVKGGGVISQAEAIRHGISRVLIIFNPDFRKRLKKAGFLKRDPRMRERKKFGLKRARRAPQWKKR